MSLSPRSQSTMMTGKSTKGNHHYILNSIQMDSVPQFRKKHVAKDKKKDKGVIYASGKHIRIELENQWRHDKKINTTNK